MYFTYVFTANPVAMKETTITAHDRLEDILYPVTKINSEELFTGTRFADDMTHCIYLPDQGKVVQMCAKTYQLVDNEYLMGQVYDKMVSVFGRTGFDTEVKSYDDRKFYVKFIVKDHLLPIVKGDDVCPVIEVQNSYDGSIKQRISTGYYRMICTNGLMAFTEAFTADKKHSTNVGKLKLDPVFKQLEQMEMKAGSFQTTDRPQGYSQKKWTRS